MRADQLLLERGLATSRSQAVRLIASGVRWRQPVPGAGWQRIAKNGQELPEAAELLLDDDAEARYVSRGGLKLEGALRVSGVAAEGRACLDVGQSTGGFTDCLLRHGAARVVGVDVGQGQVHAAVRADARVLCLEQVNARELSPERLAAALDTLDRSERHGWREADLAEPFALVVGDLSFISLTLVLPALAPLLAAGGDLLVLVKPQFELQPGDIGKGGIVRDPALFERVERRLRDACADAGLAVRGWFDSPIAGGDGNREFFIHAGRAP
ncbi:MAG: TlyA family RNA methyltransferase [Pseudomonadota bacterium]